jgi:hypothetical protein
VQNQGKQPYLSNRYTNLDAFRYSYVVNGKLSLKVPFKTEENIEAAVTYFTDTNHWAGWNSTLEHTDLPITPDYPIPIKQKVAEKRKIRKKWRRLRTSES